MKKIVYLDKNTQTEKDRHHLERNTMRTNPKSVFKLFRETF